MNRQLNGRNFKNTLLRGFIFFLGEAQTALRTNVRNSSYIQHFPGAQECAPMSNFSPSAGCRVASASTNLLPVSPLPTPLPNRMTKNKFLSLIGALLFPASALAQNHYDFSISSTVYDSTLTIGGSYQFAGAISSLFWRGREFVNVRDHGREIQSAGQFHGLGECYNPTEAGNVADTSSSSSQLLSVSTASNVLQTSNQMAFYLRAGQSGACPEGVGAPNATLSGYYLDKSVRIGFAGIPNVIEYLTTFWVPEHVSNAQVEPVFAATTDFVRAWRYDVVSKHYSKLSVASDGISGGELDAPVFLSADASGDIPELFFGIYAPESLQPYDGKEFAFGWGVKLDNSGDTGGAMRVFNRFDSVSQPSGFGPGHLHYKTYLVVGDKTEAQTAMNQLHYQFRSQDPDVFNWKEYLQMYPDVDQYFDGQSGAQAHWLVHGINEGRNGSRSFSPSTYLQLYPDLGSPTNYQYAIDHYIAWGRDEGRSTVKKADAGMYHSTVLSVGRPWSAGQNANGQLGDGTTTASNIPVATTAVGNMTKVAGGDYTSFGVRFDGTLWAWGSNQYGLLGNGTASGQANQPTQVPGLTNIVTPSVARRTIVSASRSAAAAVDKLGQVWTWGVNWSGQLGDGTTAPHYVPMRVKKPTGEYLTDILSVCVGSSQMIALDADGQVWAWGSNAYGSLGNGGSGDSYYAVKVLREDGSPLTGIAEIVSGGSYFSIAVARDGQMFAWGNNGNGQLGLGSTTGSFSRATLNTQLSGIQRIAAGAYHVVATSIYPAPGQVWAWGYSGHGQLGSTGVAVSQRTPYPMDAGPDGMGEITDVAAGGYFSLMIRGSDRAVFATGDNTYGQLGIGNRPRQNVPVRTFF